MTTPWAHLVNTERDGVWADFAAWETWLSSQMPDYAADGYDLASDNGAWKANLYAVVAGLFPLDTR